MRTKQLILLFLIASVIALFPGREVPRAGAAPVMSPSELIAAVNQLRAANGLPPYRVNNLLMYTAQSQSDYQASIQTVTHTGPGGTRPRDRAIAAGYGGGATVFISENIAGGTNLSVATAVQWWQGDAPHLNTMLGANYTDVGAGVATSGGWVYYTLDVGWISGAPGGGSQPPPAGSGATATPGALPAVPVVKATPQPDGSIIHIVRTGQALWTIAVVYSIPLDDLLALNGLTRQSLIFPGEELLIRVADPPTGTTTPSETAPPTLTSTVRPPTPSRTPRPSPSPTLSPTAAVSLIPLQGLATKTPSPNAVAPAAPWTGTAKIALIGLALVAGALVLFATVRDRKKSGL